VDEFGVATTATGAEMLVVSAYGDVDPVTAPELEAELLEAVQLGARRVFVDLTKTTFFDSSAVHMLLRSGELLRASGLQLALVCSNPNVTRVLEITGADQVLQIHSTIEEAISLPVSSKASLEPRPAMSRPVAAGSYA
jgi:anti-sigma B factor antagonist